MATKAHIYIDQGASYSTTVSVADQSGLPLELSEYTGSAQIRRWYTSSNSVSFDVLLSNNNITISLDPDATSSIPAGRYVYDVYVRKNDGSSAIRVIEGYVTISPRVTR